MGKVSKEPLISVIVPVYNVEKYLNRCVDSIINQTYKNLEIILVDDGSPDNCPKICDEYVKKDNRIKVIHKKNGGLSDARNKGIYLAKGEYITFVDSDDWVSLHFVEILYKNMIKYDADIVSCRLVEEKSNNIIIKPNNFSNKIIINNQIQYMRKFFRIDGNEVVHYACGKLYYRKFFDNNSFPVGLTSEDVVGVYKALLQSKTIVEIDYPYYYYYVNPNSITRSIFSDNDLDLLKIWELVINITPKDNIQYLQWANYNKNRTDYTLLMRMALSFSFNYIKKVYNKEYIELLSRLRKNKKELLFSKISIIRKISIILICIDYKFFVNLVSLVRRKV